MGLRFKMISLVRLMKRLFRIKRNIVKNEFNRVLPSNELFTDRWEKARFLGFGKGVSIYDSATVLGDVTVGKNTWIGPYTILDGSGGLLIGENCSISAGVHLYSHDSVQWAVTGGKKSYEYARTVIGDNCFIGANSVIAKGVTLQTGTIVGANSFVNKSFESGVKIAGNPAMEIGSTGV